MKSEKTARLKTIIVVLLLLGLPVSSFAKREKSTAIKPEEIHQHVVALTGFGGRMTGTASESQAAAYLAQQFEELGLQPWHGNSYLHNYDFTAGTHLGPDNQLRVNGQALVVDKQFRPLVFSGQGPVAPAAVVFAGYGITEPEGEKPGENYDSYTHLDVKDKWVLAYRFLPEDLSPEQRVRLAPFSNDRFKALTARQHGARGLLLVAGPNTTVKHELIPLRYDASTSQGSLPVISLSRDVVKPWFDKAGKDQQAIQARLDKGDFVMGFDLPGVQVSGQVDLEQEKKTGHNVIGVIPGSNRELPAVVIGAHYDHLGHGESSTSLARADEQGRVHPGADDNASGVAAMLEAAEYLRGLQRTGRFKPVRDVIFIGWSGEELGLLGSDQFVKSFGQQDLSDHFDAYLNMDMVGRLREAAIMQGVGSAEEWPAIIEKRNVPVGLNIKLQQDAYLPTDAMSFYLHGVPVLSAFTGSHPEYHTPRDTADLLNYPGTAKIARLVALVGRDLAMNEQPLHYRKMERKQEKGLRGGMRAYLGTIPDYAQEDGKGVRLNGATKGGPAEKAGIQPGDVIVKLADTPIENIYDYTYVLQALKVGQPVKMVVRRGKQLVELEITPGSRQ